MDVIKYKYFTGHRFLTNQNEKNNIYFLYSEKLDDSKWRVYFSFERIEFKSDSTYYASYGYGYGYASSDVLSYIVEAGSEIKFASFFSLKLHEEFVRETVFGNRKSEQ